MFSLFKRKPHVCKFKERDFSVSSITDTAFIRYQHCRCGRERVRRTFYTGTKSGRVEYEIID